MVAGHAPLRSMKAGVLPARPNVVRRVIVVAFKGLRNSLSTRGVIRPLLECHRHEILDYLTSHGLAFMRAPMIA
jgi:hypothetical protein